MPMAKYGKKAQRKVHKVMKEYKEGKLRSGRSGKRVKSRAQAIAIGLSEARKAGAKVPAPVRRDRKNKNPRNRLVTRIFIFAVPLDSSTPRLSRLAPLRRRAG